MHCRKSQTHTYLLKSKCTEKKDGRPELVATSSVTTLVVRLSGFMVPTMLGELFLMKMGPIRRQYSTRSYYNRVAAFRHRAIDNCCCLY